MSDRQVEELRPVILDGRRQYEVRCPDCGIWGLVDDDQLHGRVSMLCDCGWHHTEDLARTLPAGNV